MIARVANVFIEVLAAQERLRLAEETRVKVGLSTTRIEVEQAQWE